MISTHDDAIKWKHFPRGVNPLVTGGFPPLSPVSRSFAVFFDLRPNKRLSKQPRHWWFETPSRLFYDVTLMMTKTATTSPGYKLMKHFFDENEDFGENIHSIFLPTIDQYIPRKKIR